MITKTKLEELTEKYETVDFIKDDPIQFAHRFINSQDVEIAAFLASLFAYGNRKVFIKKLNELFKIMENKPLEFVLDFEPNSLRGFNYRFAKDFDIIEVFNILHQLYCSTPHPNPHPSHSLLRSYADRVTRLVPRRFPLSRREGVARKLNNKGDSGLSALFEHGWGLDNSILTMLQTVTDYFYSNVQNKVGMGFYHLIPNPKNGGAVKRMNMFLRWMVRKGPVDLGLWDFLPTGELLIPIDVHVARISREMGLLKRNSNDFKAVLELTGNLKQFDPNDPVKFDFAMFGLGVNG